MKVKIRKAKMTEAKILTELAMASKAYWGYSDEFMHNCREELSISNNKIINPLLHYQVAKDNNQILGFYALELLESPIIELEALFVYPKYIGKGVGKALINHAKKFAVELGAETLVIQGDPNAEKFYLASGAKLIGQEESGSIAGRCLPIFEITL